MNIQSVIAYLNKTYKYNISSDYYNNITEWHQWWQGYNKSFHQFKELCGTRARTRRLYSMKMAKKVCEDWASLLLNEKTQIVLGDAESQKFLCGDEQTKGVLGDNNFWVQANALVERVFYSGTGAFVIKLDGMQSQGKTIIKNAATKINIDFLTALNIIPITVHNGEITEVAFASEVISKGELMLYLEIHTLKDGKYVIENKCLKSEKNSVKEVPLPVGVLPTLQTGTGTPLFSIIKPNIVNCIDGNNGLGMSIYAQAIDNLMGVDLAYNNLNRDFKLGGKKVFYNDSLVRLDASGKTITPDDVMQQLFVSLGESELDDAKKLIQEFNPSLRVTENKDGIQAQLDYLSFKCGLGTKHYQFNAGSIVTATQYVGDKQELVQNASKHAIAIEKSLIDMVKAILWCGKEVLGQEVNPDTKISIVFDDSYIIDKESERLRDLQEIRDGLMQRWEYRKKWRGEDDATAKKMVGAERSNDNIMGFGDA